MILRQVIDSIKKTFFSKSSFHSYVGILTLVVLTLAIITAAVLTYVHLSQDILEQKTVYYVLGLIALDSIVLVALTFNIARRLYRVWREHKEGLAGSRLHLTLTVLFGFLAVAPAVILAVVSLLVFHFGIQSWFQDQVKKGFNESLSVANAYLEEHNRVIERDAKLMAMDLTQALPDLLSHPEKFSEYLDVMSNLRGLKEAIIFDEDQNILGKSALTLALQFEYMPVSAIEKADVGDVVTMMSSNKNRVRALVQLGGHPKTYLYVGRFVDPNVLEHLQNTKNVVETHAALAGEKFRFEISFGLIFLLVAFLMLVLALWLGLLLAGQIVGPVRKLIEAVERISEGDLHARVPETNNKDEFTILSRAFNRMASRLLEQHTQLLKVNQALEDRHRFIQSILKSASIGIIGLDAYGKVMLSNDAANTILDVDFKSIEGKNLVDRFSFFQPIVSAAKNRPGAVIERQINVPIHTYQEKTLNVHFTCQHNNQKVRGFVVTLEDITELLAAQRLATWSEVARRIAHEIKNPLTPIQLSAERLGVRLKKEKGLKETDFFQRYIETIVRQVDQIRHLIDEFASFARMPKPIFALEDIVNLCEKAIFIEKIAYPNIIFEVRTEKKPLWAMCDAKQMHQVLVNILKNGIESLENSQKEHPKILVNIKSMEEHVEISIQDNGPGITQDKLSTILEPYVTTKSQGTGLGLAIVKKIMADHKGRITVESLEQGLLVRLVLPIEKGIV